MGIISLLAEHIRCITSYFWQNVESTDLCGSNTWNWTTSNYHSILLYLW